MTREELQRELHTGPPQAVSDRGTPYVEGWLTGRRHMATLIPRPMNPGLKAKGRSISALRIGLRAAQEALIRSGDKAGAEDCTKALKRSERMEHGA